MITGLGLLYKSTGKQSYLDEAHALFDFAIDHFTDANNVIYEPPCGPGPLQTMACKSPNGYTWIWYKALGKFYQITPDAARKQRIATVLKTTALANFAQCPDTVSWDCVRTMPEGTRYDFDRFPCDLFIFEITRNPPLMPEPFFCNSENIHVP
jgi:hypothetical protein